MGWFKTLSWRLGCCLRNVSPPVKWSSKEQSGHINVLEETVLSTSPASEGMDIGYMWIPFLSLPGTQREELSLTADLWCPIIQSPGGGYNSMIFFSFFFQISLSMSPQGSGFIRIACFRLASSTVAFERSSLTIFSLILYCWLCLFKFIWVATVVLHWYYYNNICLHGLQNFQSSLRNWEGWKELATEGLSSSLM